MSCKYKFIDQQGVYFITSAVTGWMDLFTRELYRNILLDSLRYCQKNKGLQIHAWVLMTNHLHMICSFTENVDGGRVLRDMKSFTAMKLIDAIINNPNESRRQWALNLFEKEGNDSKHQYKFWQYENHPFLLHSTSIYNQKLNYIHENPVRAGFVNEQWHWNYSSAIDYCTDREGLLDILLLE